MAYTGHNYGPSCSLQTDSNVFIRRASVVSDQPPKTRAQFFYNSALPIDDPLSPVPLPSSSSTGPSKFPPRPFSVFDNTVLEETWQSLQALEHGEERVETARTSHTDVPTADNLAKIVRTATRKKPKDNLRKSNNLSATGQDGELKSVRATAETATNGERAAAEAPDEEHHHKKMQEIGDPHLMLCDDPSHVPFDETMPVSSDEIGNDEFESAPPKKRHRSPFRRKEKAERQEFKEEARPRRRPSAQKEKAAEEQYGSSPLERDTTGTPFLRVPSRKSKSRSRSSEREIDRILRDDAGSNSESEGKKGSPPVSIRENSSICSNSHGPELEEHSKSDRSSRHKQKEHHRASVAVGVSRLHLVKMPELKVCAQKILSRRR